MTYIDYLIGKRRQRGLPAGSALLFRRRRVRFPLLPIEASSVLPLFAKSDTELAPFHARDSHVSIYTIHEVP